jgi:hypothetical protein
MLRRMPSTPAQPKLSAAVQLHRAQKALVAASLLACPASKPTHRRWA